jgi:hypothetical protein
VACREQQVVNAGSEVVDHDVPPAGADVLQQQPMLAW